MAEEKSTVIMLNKVRIAFPVLFVAEQFEGKGTFSYSAKFLIPKGSENDKKIQAAISLAAGKWEKKKDEMLRQIVGQTMKYCYIDGEVKSYAGSEGCNILTAKRNQDDGRPDVMDRNPKNKLSAADGRIYSGCVVNAKVDIWAQVKGTGAPGMRCTLIAVQFSEDGESFGGAPPANDSGFESVEETSEEFV